MSIDLKEIVRMQRDGGDSKRDAHTDSNSSTHIKIPRFTEKGERIYMLSVGDIAKYCGMKRQNVTHYCRNNPDVFYKIERLGQKDARVLGIPFKEDEEKMRTYLIYVTKQQMENIKPFAYRIGKKRKKNIK